MVAAAVLAVGVVMLFARFAWRSPFFNLAREATRPQASAAVETSRQPGPADLPVPGRGRGHPGVRLVSALRGAAGVLAAPATGRMGGQPWPGRAASWVRAVSMASSIRRSRGRSGRWFR